LLKDLEGLSEKNHYKQFNSDTLDSITKQIMEETKPKNYGNPWTKALEVELMECVDRGCSSEEIAKKLERTTVSVELNIKRIKMGVLI